MAIAALNSFSAGSKAVVFTRFRATLGALSAALDAAGVPHRELTAGFTGLADELAAARGHYEKVKAFDEAIFRRDFET